MEIVSPNGWGKGSSWGGKVEELEGLGREEKEIHCSQKNEMSPVRIRLARFGVRNAPFYRIYVADSRSPRNGRHIELVGTYDPLPGPKEQRFDF